MDFSKTASFQFSKAANVFRNLLERKMTEIGLHSGQVFVLVELWRTDGQRQIDLASRLRLSPPTVNKILGGLIGSDFVTRGRYEDDARSTRIYLTQKGIDVQEQVEQQWIELEELVLGELTETERLILLQLLEKIIGGG